MSRESKLNGLFFLVGTLLLWELISQAGWANPLILPRRQRGPLVPARADPRTDPREPKASGSGILFGGDCLYPYRSVDGTVR